MHPVSGLFTQLAMVRLFIFFIKHQEVETQVIELIRKKGEVGVL